MKKLFLGLSLLLCALSTKASHLMGGDITVYPISSTQYAVKIVHYRDTGGVAAYATAQCELFTWDAVTSSWYNCVPFTVPMDSTQSGSAIPNFPYGVEVYTYSDTIPAQMAAGTRYRLLASECCRNQAIVNMSMASSEFMTLLADFAVPAASLNTSPQFLAMPIVYLPVSQPWTYNPLPYDVDGDSISWSTATPYSANAPFNPLPPYVLGYYLPPSAASGPFSLNATTGQLSWTPSVTGNYVASFTITEYKNGVAAGSINRDMQYVVVADSLAPVPQFSPVASTPYMWDTASESAYIYYTPGQPLQFRLRGSDAGSPQMTMECISPLFMRTPPPVFTTGATGTGNQIEGTLSWTPSANEAGTSTAVFRLRNGVFSKDFTLLLKKNPNPTVVGTVAKPETVLSVFPNPATSELNIRFQTPQAKDVTVQLADLTGKNVATLFQGTLPKGQWTLRESLTYAPGTYFVQVRGRDGAVIGAEKVVIR